MDNEEKVILSADEITMYKVQFMSMFSYVENHLPKDAQNALASILESLVYQLSEASTLQEENIELKAMVKELKKVNTESIKKLFHAKEEIERLKKENNTNRMRILSYKKLEN